MPAAKSKKSKASSPVEEKPAEVEVKEVNKVEKLAPAPRPEVAKVKVEEKPKVVPKVAPKKFEVGAKVRMPNGKDALIISLKDDIAKMKTELSSNKIYSQPLSNLELI